VQAVEHPAWRQHQQGKLSAAQLARTYVGFWRAVAEPVLLQGLAASRSREAAEQVRRASSCAGLARVRRVQAPLWAPFPPCSLRRSPPPPAPAPQALQQLYARMEAGFGARPRPLAWPYLYAHLRRSGVPLTGAQAEAAVGKGLELAPAAGVV
jgi:hypothetical protein